MLRLINCNHAILKIPALLCVLLCIRSVLHSLVFYTHHMWFTLGNYHNFASKSACNKCGGPTTAEQAAATETVKNWPGGVNPASLRPGAPLTHSSVMESTVCFHRIGHVETMHD